MREVIIDEMIRLDRKADYREYIVLPMITAGGCSCKILDDQGRVIVTTRTVSNMGQAEIDANQVIKKLVHSKIGEIKTMTEIKTPRDLIIAEIQKMPKHTPVEVEEDEITVKIASQMSGSSVSMCKNRLERLVIAGKVTKSKRSTTTIYKWIPDSGHVE